jgi:hypothetical protein
MQPRTRGVVLAPTFSVKPTGRRRVSFLHRPAAVHEAFVGHGAAERSDSSYGLSGGQATSEKVAAKWLGK